MVWSLVEFSFNLKLNPPKENIKLYEQAEKLYLRYSHYEKEQENDNHNKENAFVENSKKYNKIREEDIKKIEEEYKNKAATASKNEQKELFDKVIELSDEKLSIIKKQEEESELRIQKEFEKKAIDRIKRMQEEGLDTERYQQTKYISGPYLNKEHKTIIDNFNKQCQFKKEFNKKLILASQLLNDFFYANSNTVGSIYNIKVMGVGGEASLKATQTMYKTEKGWLFLE